MRRGRHRGDPRVCRGELEREIASGVRFSCLEDGARVLGVMGIQDVEDVTLVRHAYVRTDARRRGIGSRLLRHLLARTDRPVLMGTWAAAEWAVRFYEKHGFRLVTPEARTRLLRRYWSIPEWQVRTSVVLADGRWRGRSPGDFGRS